MPEVPHNWSLGLRRPLVALLGGVTVEEYSRSIVQTPGTKEHGPVFQCWAAGTFQYFSD